MLMSLSPKMKRAAKLAVNLAVVLIVKIFIFTIFLSDEQNRREHRVEFKFSEVVRKIKKEWHE